MMPTLLFVGTKEQLYDLKSEHGGDNDYEPICYRCSHQRAEGKEQDDTASPVSPVYKKR